MRSLSLYVFGLITLVLFSCGGDEPGISGEELQKIEAYLDSVGINASPDENGIYQWLISPNTDPSQNNSGDIFTIQYELYELDGMKLIDSVTDNTTIKEVVLQQGTGSVFPVGIDNALGYINAGETRGFIIPSSMSYGNLSLAGISNNATLLMEVTLKEVRTQAMLEADEDVIIDQYVDDNLGGQAPPLPLGENTRYKTTQQGVFGSGVIENDTVGISYVMKTLDGTQIDARGAADPFLFIVDQVPGPIKGINVGVKEMQLNERAVLVIPSPGAYFQSVAVIPAYLIDNQVIQSEDNPLIIENIIPDYASRVAPFEIILVELQLVSIN